MRRLILLLSSLLVCGAAVSAHAQQPPAPSAPAASIEPPSGERLLLEVRAEGVQNYSCVTENGASAWKFQGPEAKLTTSTGSPAGSHFAGPTWKLLDGSEVKGSVAASKPAPEAGAVPWLLVKVVSHTGEGKLSAAEYVTRTNTKGGVAPQSGCDAAHQGAAAPVPYSATYRFYGK
jgi:Protein of unknown function (DUF3455)